jgi:hypothetical protein
MRFIALTSFIYIISLANLSAQNSKEDIIKKNLINGEVGLRTFFMSTNYKADYKEDFALGQSAYLSLKTTQYKGLSVKSRYTLFANVWSSNLTERDPLTGNFNRYEVGLFDVINPDSKLFGKLEELNVNYSTNQLEISAGRMGINTTFINPQDGRLSPTFVQGLKVKYQPSKRNNLTLYIIDKISPRSTSEWFSIGETIGIYPVGQSVFGAPSKYRGNTTSKYISVIEWQHLTPQGLELVVNQTYVQNISHTMFLQGLKDWKLKTTKSKLITGVQLVAQNGLRDGGNEDENMRFKHPEDFNYIISARLGLKNSKNIFHLNFTRINGNGRFLSPREWGRDPFFTFIPRERNEGYNEVTAYTAFYQRNIPNKGLQIYGFGGLHFLPHPSLAELNKYAFPSYAQINFGTKYKPKTWGKGLDFHVIYLKKYNLLKGELKPQWEYNKVNMSHVNIIANYTLPWN